MTALDLTLRPTLVGWLYVLGVAVVSTIGFSTGSTTTILLAAVLALPSSVVAVPMFYLGYGLLALVPGANPSSSTGAGSCTAAGVCEQTTTGDPAAWFTFATESAGVLALTAAALLNAVVLHHLIAARRARVSATPRPGH